MKKSILVTSLVYVSLVALFFSCKKEEQEKEKTCDHKKSNVKILIMHEGEIYAQAVKSPTDNNIYTWYLDVDDVCPAGNETTKFEISVTSGQQSNMSISFGRLLTTSSTTYYAFYTPTGAEDSEHPGEYKFTGATSQVKPACESCDDKTWIKSRLSVQVKITGPGITDYAKYMSDHIKDIYVAYDYSQPGTN